MKERKHLDQQSVVKLALWMHTVGHTDDAGVWIYNDGWSDRKAVKHWNENGGLNCELTLGRFIKMRNKSFGPRKLTAPKPKPEPAQWLETDELNQRVNRMDCMLSNLQRSNSDIENKVARQSTKINDHAQSISAIMQDFKTGASIQRDEISDLSKVYEKLKERITELELRLAKEEMKPLTPKPISLPSWHPDRDKK